MKFKKVLLIVVLSLGLLFNLTTFAVAAEKGGTGGHSSSGSGHSAVEKAPETQNTSKDTKSDNTQTQPSGQADGHGNMDMGMGMNSGTSSTMTDNQKEATNDMGMNMSGMGNEGKQAEEHGSSSGSDGHGEEPSASEGVNWGVVGGFSAVNLLIVTIAGVLKFT